MIIVKISLIERFSNRSFAYAYQQWYRNNPGKESPFTIFLDCQVNHFDFTPANLIAGFAKTRICLFNWFQQENGQIFRTIRYHQPSDNDDTTIVQVFNYY